MVGPPLGLVGVDVGLDLLRPGAERSRVRRQLNELAGLSVQCEPASRQRLSKPRIGHHRRVPDPVDRLQAVADADRVQPAPLAVDEHAGVDLEMQVPVRVAGPRGEVAYDGRLDLLHRDLHLVAARPDPGGGVRCEPTDDLFGRCHLGGVVGGGDLGIQRRRQRPRLRAVDRDFDEPDAVLVRPKPALRESGVAVVSGDPSFVRLAVHVSPSLDPDPLVELVETRSEVHRDPAALGEVVVVRADPIGLHVVSSGGWCAAVDLHAAMHRNHLRQQPSTTVKPQVSGHNGARPTTKLRSMRAA
jgi:hypothetical protein